MLLCAGMITSMSKASARFSDERGPVFDIPQQDLIGIPRLAPRETGPHLKFFEGRFRAIKLRWTSVRRNADARVA
jgi:hypothetical protein